MKPRTLIGIFGREQIYSAADLQARDLEMAALVRRIDCVISGADCGKCENCVTRGKLLAMLEATYVSM